MQKRDDRAAGLDDLALFLEVARRGSFAAAARALGLPTSTVSRRIAGLEARLRTQLLRRTTRRVRLTDEGGALAAHADAPVEELRATLATIEASADRPIEGVLRVAAPVMLGRDRIGPLLLAFAAAHPGLRLEMQLANQTVNLLESGADVAFRVGPLPDSDHIARYLWSVPYSLVVAPEYARRHPELASLDAPEALRSFDCVATPPIDRWRFEHVAAGEQRSIEPGPGDRLGDLLLGLRAVEAGRGIGYLPDEVIARDGRRALERITPGAWRPVTRDLYAVFPRTRWLAPRVRAAVEFIVAHAGEGAAVRTGNGGPVT